MSRGTAMLVGALLAIGCDDVMLGTVPSTDTSAGGASATTGGGDAGGVDIGGGGADGLVPTLEDCADEQVDLIARGDGSYEVPPSASALAAALVEAPDTINIFVQADGAGPVAVPYVTDPSACTTGSPDGGWFFVVPAPPIIALCPSTAALPIQRVILAGFCERFEKS